MNQTIHCFCRLGRNLEVDQTLTEHSCPPSFEVPLLSLSASRAKDVVWLPRTVDADCNEDQCWPKVGWAAGSTTTRSSSSLDHHTCSMDFICTPGYFIHQFNHYCFCRVVCVADGLLRTLNAASSMIEKVAFNRLEGVISRQWWLAALPLVYGGKHANLQG